MIDNYSNLSYDFFEIVNENRYEIPVFNKLQIFDKFKDGQNIYFDLDILIKGDCSSFLTEQFTLCHAWWRQAFHTKLNSSIMSWQGDMSEIYNKFNEDPEYWMLKYYKGIDQYIEEQIDYHVYDKSNYASINWVKDEKAYPIYLFNQQKDLLKQQGWFSKYTYA
jgi:hypothetical protein